MHFVNASMDRAGLRPRQVRPRPKVPLKNKIFLEKKGLIFYS